MTKKINVRTSIKSPAKMSELKALINHIEQDTDEEVDIRFGAGRIDFEYSVRVETPGERISQAMSQLEVKQDGHLHFELFPDRMVHGLTYKVEDEHKPGEGGDWAANRLRMQIMNDEWEAHMNRVRRFYGV